jgi:DNA-binding NtrC family response regulator
LLETEQLPVRPPVILVTGNGDIEMAVDAMRNGAHDFLTKPVTFKQINQSIQRAVEVVRMRRELAHLRHLQQQKGNFVAGKSREMQSVLMQAQRAANASVSVMITGETGTGKEVLANFIHNSGPRAGKPFMAINCAAIQMTLLESELFGYEPNAFTGAERRKHGLIEIADGGVLFLDEMASMPLDMQAKMLRVLEERAFRRVGGTQLVKVDVQVVAASNKDLQALIKQGEFREDLYYRLKVVDLHLPPLRERREDIPELVGFFMRNYNQKLGVNIQDITPRAMKAFLTYAWPGNIRELSNAIERAMLFCDDPAIDISHLPMDVARSV